MFAIQRTEMNGNKTLLSARYETKEEGKWNCTILNRMHPLNLYIIVEVEEAKTIAAHIAQSVKTTEMNSRQVFDAILIAYGDHGKNVNHSCPFTLTIHFTDGSVVRVIDRTASFEAGLTPRKYAVIDQDKLV